MAGSIAQRPNGKYRARYRDKEGREHAKHFAKQKDAKAWLEQESAKLVRGDWTDPKNAKLTVGQWCELWLATQASNRTGTTRQAATHVKRIEKRFGKRPLGSLRPSDVKTWMAELKAEGLAQGTRFALHSRLRQIYADAIEDNLVSSNPVTRRTSPGMGKQRPYVATAEQVAALEAAMPENLRLAVAVASCAGLRAGEVCGLRVVDLDLMRGVIHVRQQYGDEPLKTEGSAADLPIPQELALELAAHVSHGGEWVFLNEWGDACAPWVLQRHFRKACESVPGLPEGFRFHDLRHYYASVLLASGLDVKKVQASMRHASAATTLDTYGHLMPDEDSTGVAAVSAARAKAADSLRTAEGVAGGQV